MKNTDFANHGWDIVKRLSEYITAEVKPRIDAIAAQKPPMPRGPILVGIYSRMILWNRTLVALNGYPHFQAILSGARSLFELYIDLKWLEKFTDPIWVECFNRFPDIDKCHSAQKVIKHVTDHPSSSVDITCPKAWLAQFPTLDQTIARLWPHCAKSGKLAKPPLHWTGVDLAMRAEKVDCLDEYRNLYSQLSAFVHSGGSAYLGKDAAFLETMAALGYNFSFRYIYASTFIVCEAFGIDKAISNWPAALQQLAVWQEESMQHYNK